MNNFYDSDLKVEASENQKFQVTTLGKISINILVNICPFILKKIKSN